MAKHRNGGLGTALVRAVMRTGAYTDLPENEPHVVGVIETVPDYQPTGLRIGTAGDFGQPAPLAEIPLDRNAPF